MLYLTYCFVILKLTFAMDVMIKSDHMFKQYFFAVLFFVLSISVPSNSPGFYSESPALV